MRLIENFYLPFFPYAGSICKLLCQDMQSALSTYAHINGNIPLDTHTHRDTHIRINYMLKQQKATGRKMQKKCLTRRRNDLHCMIKGMAKNARGKKESRQEEVEALAEPEAETEVEVCR